MGKPAEAVRNQVFGSFAYKTPAITDVFSAPTDILKRKNLVSPPLSKVQSTQEVGKKFSGVKITKEAITMIQELQGFWQDETGQGLIEYIAIIVTVLVISVPILNQIMNEVKRIFEGILRELENYQPGS